MTLTLLDLYNSVASQEWSMYDGDAESTDEFEKALLIDLNKAVLEILYSYPFSFRQKTHVILTLPKVDVYPLPNGLILKDDSDNYSVKINSQSLKLIKEPQNLGDKKGIPTGFYIKGDQICFYPIPAEKSIIVVDYLTLSIGENKDGNEIFSLKNDDDIISIPQHLEEIFKQAVISRTMLNLIASEGDENYSAYKKQSETAYRLLVKYSKGVGLDKKIQI